VEPVVVVERVAGIAAEGGRRGRGEGVVDRVPVRSGCPADKGPSPAKAKRSAASWRNQSWREKKRKKIESKNVFVQVTKKQTI
jgi:hypothetical protein